MKKAATSQGVEENSLDIYLREISKFPLLSPEEEIRLARRIRSGDRKALEQLSTSNLRFVVNIAKVYQKRGTLLCDLINEGNIGLIKAAQRFNPDRGVRFISYAVWWIRQAILKAMADSSTVVRLPVSKTGRIRKVARTQAKLSQKAGREPTIEEIAKRLGVDPVEVADAMSLAKRDISLDAPFSADESLSISDLLKSTTYPSPEEQFFRRSFQKEIEKEIENLSSREAEIVTLYFGFSKERPHTLEEIGEKVGLSRERVRQIKERALGKLRRSLESSLS